MIGLWSRRDVLFMLTWRDVKIKYKQSVMGFFWAILMPLVIVSAGVIVRYAFARLSDTPLLLDDLAMVTVKAVPWAFFVAAIRFASNSLIANTNLVTKIYMPREIFPIAAILFAIGGPPLTTAALWIPLLVLLLVLLTAAAGIFLSAAALFFRDVKYIVEVILTFAIFFTPVFYEASLFGEWAPVLLLNPVAPLLEAIGAAAVGHPLPAPAWIAYSGAVALGGFALALVFFKKLEPLFAESV
jgi:ABC-type polysaccharide/polyol phosphate export permease